MTPPLEIPNLNCVLVIYKSINYSLLIYYYTYKEIKMGRKKEHNSSVEKKGFPQKATSLKVLQ